MAQSMFASAPTADGRWYAVRIRPKGLIMGVIPGLFGTKADSDSNAKREVGFSD
jgi:hypothetical protein